MHSVTFLNSVTDFYVVTAQTRHNMHNPCLVWASSVAGSRARKNSADPKFPSMNISFKGKRALVTGAGKGIGRGAVKALVQCGAEVIALSRTQKDLDTLKAELPSIKTICMDVSDTEHVTQAIQQMDDIHLLVNNAGILIAETFLETTIEAFDNIVNINFKAAFFVAQAVARKMVAGGYEGSIVNISSDSAKRSYAREPVYASMKAALDRLTKNMALELGPHKIRVNAVNPCITRTRMGLGVIQDEAEMKEILSITPLGRLAEVHEVVDAILFLLSDQASMIHGTALGVDGGILVA